MVEGVAHLFDDQRNDAVQVFHHIGRGNPQDSISARVQVLIAPLVTCRSPSEAMAPAIHFNDQCPIADEEVRHIWPDRMLPPNFESQFAAAKLIPQKNFGRTHAPP
jgi:hypothetical protein